MKTRLLLSLLVTAISPLALAEVKGSISGVHNCCQGCEKAIMKVAESISGIKVTPKGGTLNIEAKGKSDIKKFQEKLLDAGFYGTIDGEGGSSASEKPANASASASSGKKVKSATVSGAHICCQKCRDMVWDTVRSLPGVKSTDVMPKVSSFKVEGEFSKDDLEAALRKAGFGGKVR
jgi:copper chaperone CopZ